MRRHRPKYVAAATGGGRPLLLELNEGFSGVSRFGHGRYLFRFEEPVVVSEVLALVRCLPAGIMASLEVGTLGCKVLTYKIGRRKMLPRDAMFRLEVVRVAAPRPGRRR